MHSSSDIHELIRRLAADIKRLEHEIQEIRMSLQKDKDNVG